eukprot:9422151-Pyramimonas_sp.AAC.1
MGPKFLNNTRIKQCVRTSGSVHEIPVLSRSWHVTVPSGEKISKAFGFRRPFQNSTTVDFSDFEMASGEQGRNQTECQNTWR